ncbi:unnamed protein product, partial [Amoebophrya sp. A120]
GLLPVTRLPPGVCTPALPLLFRGWPGAGNSLSLPGGELSTDHAVRGLLLCRPLPLWCLSLISISQNPSRQEDGHYPSSWAACRFFAVVLSCRRVFVFFSCGAQSLITEDNDHSEQEHGNGIY